MTFTRRSVLRMLQGFAFWHPLTAPGALEAPDDQFAAIERGIQCRLGVAATDAGSGKRVTYRGNELFALCSTFKLLLAADVLQRVDSGSLYLDSRISYTEQDLLEYAPVSRAHLKVGSMTVEELCAAAVEVSDNTAANLLFAQIGGPTGLTGFLRSLGNQVTRLDRTEPELNSALPGDPRDTTSPEAMVESMQKLLTGEGLLRGSRTKLVDWLEKCSTGEKRLRAGFPAAWRAGDKTGTGERGAMGDVGIFWPPRGKDPILVAAYVMEGNGSRDARERAIAAAGRVVYQAFKGN